MLFRVEWVYTLSGQEIVREPETIEANSIEQAKDIFCKNHPNVYSHEIKNVTPIVRRWSSEQTQYFKECYDYLKENQPLSEPFGVSGKKKQAEWRANNHLAFVDPVMSNLSSWGAVLRKRGYVEQKSDGTWVTTDMVWREGEETN